MFINLFISTLIQNFSDSRHKVVLSEQDPSILQLRTMYNCHVSCKGFNVYYIYEMNSLNV